MIVTVCHCQLCQRRMCQAGKIPGAFLSKLWWQGADGADGADGAAMPRIECIQTIPNLSKRIGTEI